MEVDSVSKDVKEKAPSSEIGEGDGKEPGAEPGKSVSTDTKAPRLALTAKDIFNGIDDTVYIKDGDKWIEEIVDQKHSTLPKIFLHSGGWREIDPLTMQAERPTEGEILKPELKRSSSMGDICSTVALVPGASTNVNYGPNYAGSSSSYKSPMRLKAGSRGRSSHGFAGLMNQGATCYLNSFIQTLYMSMDFRDAILRWRFDEKRDPEQKRCLTYQLQNLFARLQVSKKGAASTKALTTSFGWSGSEVYQQQDVVEMAQVWFEFLNEQSCKSLQKTVHQFEAKIEDYRTCLECGNRRTTPQKIMGIPLAIDHESVTSVKKAFEKYLEAEVLDEDNKVFCDDCGIKQPLKKGFQFSEVNNLLFVQLNRWTFNFHTLKREKLNKVIEFELELDFGPFVADSEPANSPKTPPPSKEPVIYELYSMMIHRGGTYGGHYFAYIKDFKSGSWFEFNDSRVEKIGDEEFEQMMDPERARCANESNTYSSGRTSPLVGAYMLMYRKKGECINEVQNDIIDPEILKAIEEADKEWNEEASKAVLNMKYKKVKTEFSLPKDKSFEENFVEIRKHFHIDEDVRRQDMRLRLLCDGEGGPIIEAEDMNQKLEDMNFDGKGEAFLLEQKLPNEEFEEYKAKMRKFSLYTLNSKLEINSPESVEIAENATSKDIRVAVAEKLGLELSKTRVFAQYEAILQQLTPAIDEMDISGTPSLRVVEDLFAEEGDCEDDENSHIMNWFETKEHTKEFQYNLLEKEEVYNQSIIIDDRITLKQFRELLAKNLGVEPMSFRMHEVRMGKELRDLEKKVMSYRVVHERIALTKGKPLQQGDLLINLYLDTEEDGEERFRPLRGSFLINTSWNLAQLKEEIDKVDDDEMPKLYRVRKKYQECLTNFMPSNKTIKKGIPGISEGSNLVVQPIKEPEDLDSTFIIITLVRWFPKTGKSDQKGEFALRKKFTTMKLKEWILETVGTDDVDDENLVFSYLKTSGSGKNNYTDRNWDTSNLQEEHTIAKYPWFLKNGDIIVYKDKREKIPVVDWFDGYWRNSKGDKLQVKDGLCTFRNGQTYKITEDAENYIFNASPPYLCAKSHDKDHPVWECNGQSVEWIRDKEPTEEEKKSGGSAVSSWRRAEVPIKIYSAKEQIEREKQKESKEESDAKDDMTASAVEGGCPVSV